MKLYIIFISTAMAIIAALNIVFETASVVPILLAVFVCTAMQFTLDGAIAILIRLTPDSWYGSDNSHFDVSDLEIKLYTRIGVRRWKDKVLELGFLGGFSKKSVKEPNNPEYVERFIVECNRGVVTHRLSYFIGFLAMLTFDDVRAFTVAIPVACVNLVLNVLPTVVLRFNTPKLKCLLSLLERRIAKEESDHDLEAETV